MAEVDKGGRPSEYRDAHCRIAKSMCKLGATDREVAEALGVSEQTLNTWKHKHPRFLKALRVGKRAADDRVESAFYRRAVGDQFEDGKYLPPDPGACLSWLKNRRGEKWRDTKTNEVYTPPGKALLVASDRDDLLAEYHRRQQLALTAATAASGEGVERNRREPDASAGDPATGED